MAASGWIDCKLGDILTLQRGFDLPKQDRREGSVPIISSSGVSGYHDKAKAKGPGVVTGRYGTLGEVFFLTENYWPLNTTLYVSDFKGNDPRFLSYFLRTLNLAHQNAAGAVPGLNRNHLHMLPVVVPEPVTQRRIAAVLSAYDDLIENNTRRIALLEELARRLYREWFVDLRFPGHEGVPLRETEIGPVPEGWEVKQLGEIAQEIRRSVNPDTVAPETPYYGLEHIPRKSIAQHEWGTARDVQSTKLRVRAGEILFGKIRPYFHKVSVAPVDGVASTDAIVISTESPVHYPTTLCCVSSEGFVNHATLTSQGTKMPRANWDVLVKYPVAIPSQPLLDAFNELVEDLVPRHYGCAG